MDKYVRGKVLGRGSFGCAVLVACKATGKQFVVKEVSVRAMPAAEREAAKQEAEVRTSTCKRHLLPRLCLHWWSLRAGERGGRWKRCACMCTFASASECTHLLLFACLHS